MSPSGSTRWSMRSEKTDSGAQGEVEPGRAEGVPLADVGLPPGSGELDGRGAAGVGGPVRDDPEAEGVVPGASPLQGDLRHRPRPDHSRTVVEATPPGHRRAAAGPQPVLRDLRPLADGDLEL